MYKSSAHRSPASTGPSNDSPSMKSHNGAGRHPIGSHSALAAILSPIAFGVIGLFVGPVVLVVGYTLLTAWIEAQYAIDPQRIYLTGFSLGGFGTWALGLSSPDRFAALVPVAGGWESGSDAVLLPLRGFA
jgi:pimeloyl-ACP methyl ester carboxylesterase